MFPSKGPDMALNIGRTADLAIHAAAFAAGFTVARVAMRAVENALRAIDDALDGIDFGDLEQLDMIRENLENEPCICGSGEHHSALAAESWMWGEFNNTEFGNFNVSARFVYRETDPFAIQLTMIPLLMVQGTPCSGDPVTWSFARDLIDTALMREDGSLVGDGDVRASYLPAQDDLVLWFTDHHNASHSVRFDAPGVSAFMMRTFQLVPAGQETADVDGALGHLLNGTWEQ